MRRSALFVTAIIGLAFVAMQTPVLGAEFNPRIQELQEGLNELGYDAGPTDGLLGPSTMSAIKQFQKDHELPVTGKYSGILLFHVTKEVNIKELEDTPDHKAKVRKQRQLLALSDEEIIKRLKRNDQKKAEEMLNLLGERARSLPARIVFDVIGLEKLTNSFLLAPLNALYYPMSREGVRQFQSDIGDEPTGELTVAQFEELQRRFTRLRDTPVYASGIGDELSIVVVSGFLSVEGTWTLEDDDIAYPVNKSKIRCSRADRECDVIQADLVVPSIDDTDDSYLININVDTYTISSWGDNEVIARTTGQCRITTLSININSNEVYEITRNNETKRCREGYLTLPALDKPKIAKLVPSWEKTYQWWQERRKEVSEYVNPRFRDEMQRTIDDSELSQ